MARWEGECEIGFEGTDTDTSLTRTRRADATLLERVLMSVGLAGADRACRARGYWLDVAAYAATAR